MPELNEFEKQLVEEWNQALDWARMAFPQYSVRTERQRNVDKGRYDFYFIVKKDNKEKYICTFAHTSSVYEGFYLKMIYRAFENGIFSE